VRQFFLNQLTQILLHLANLVERSQHSRQNPCAFSQSSSIEFHQQDNEVLHFLRSLTCNCNNLTFPLFTNNHKWGIMGKYHATLAGTLLTFLFSSMSSSLIFLSFRLYHDVLQIQYFSNMASSIACNHFNMNGFSQFPILMDKQFS
jgi:hypothetical protein